MLPAGPEPGPPRKRPMPRPLLRDIAIVLAVKVVAITAIAAAFFRDDPAQAPNAERARAHLIAQDAPAPASAQ